MSETWVWNETVTLDDIKTFNISFMSNNTTYTTIHADGLKTAQIEYDSTTVYDQFGSGWLNQAYRTVTFLESPTGDLLTFLQANATKQSTGGISLKNLSSYNQDLSVPRKKDLDALEAKVDNKQPKITVNGIVQGDGAGNLSAAEVVEADVITISVLPTVTSTDDGKFLRVVSGAWAAASVPDANGGAF